jgi:hypothetical protein
VRSSVFVTAAGRTYPVSGSDTLICLEGRLGDDAKMSIGSRMIVSCWRALNFLEFGMLGRMESLRYVEVFRDDPWQNPFLSRGWGNYAKDLKQLVVHMLACEGGSGVSVSLVRGDERMGKMWKRIRGGAGYYLDLLERERNRRGETR